MSYKNPFINELTNKILLIINNTFKGLIKMFKTKINVNVNNLET